MAFLKPGLDHLRCAFLHIPRVEAHPAGFIQEGSCQTRQRCAPQALSLLRRRRVKHVGAAPLLGRYHAGLIQDAVGPGNSVEIDPQLGRQLADRGELALGLKHTGRNEMLYALNQLHIDRRVAAKIKFRKHHDCNNCPIVSLYYCINCIPMAVLCQVISSWETSVPSSTFHAW